MFSFRGLLVFLWSASSFMAYSASVVFLFSPGLLRLLCHILLPWSSCSPLVFFVFYSIFGFRDLLVLPWSSSSSMACSASVIFLFSPGLLRLPWLFFARLP
jgi:hypothetical protein